MCVRLPLHDDPGGRGRGGARAARDDSPRGGRTRRTHPRERRAGRLPGRVLAGTDGHPRHAELRLRHHGPGQRPGAPPPRAPGWLRPRSRRDGEPGADGRRVRHLARVGAGRRRPREGRRRLPRDVRGHVRRRSRLPGRPAVPRGRRSGREPHHVSGGQRRDRFGRRCFCHCDLTTVRGVRHLLVRGLDRGHPGWSGAARRRGERPRHRHLVHRLHGDVGWRSGGDGRDRRPPGDAVPRLPGSRTGRRAVRRRRGRHHRSWLLRGQRRGHRRRLGRVGRRDAAGAGPGQSGRTDARAGWSPLCRRRAARSRGLRGGPASGDRRGGAGPRRRRRGGEGPPDHRVRLRGRHWCRHPGGHGASHGVPRASAAEQHRVHDGWGDLPHQRGTARGPVVEPAREQDRRRRQRRAGHGR